MLGQTYDVSHFPVMPIMLRALPEDLPEEERPSSRPTMTTASQDERPSETSCAVPKSSASSSKPEISGLSSLHKCTRCHMAFLSATGLNQHMQERHDPILIDPDHASTAHVHKKVKTSRTIQQMLGLPPTGPIPEAPKQFECPLCLDTIGRKALIGHLRREHQAVHTGDFPFVPDHDMLPGSLTCRHCYSTFTMEQALITHFKRGSCPVLMCQRAKAQHFGTTTVSELVPMKLGVDHTLPTLLHRYFDLSQAGREYDPEPCPTFDLVSLWFPMLYTPRWTPLQCVAWFRYTTDWFSHFPEMPHTNFVTDQAFAMIRVLGHHPPIAWAWTLDTDCIPQQQWHADPVHEGTRDQLAFIQHVLGQLAQILAQNELHQPITTAQDGPAPDGRRSILPGLVDSLPRRLQKATTRDIVHRPPEEWPRAAKTELDLIYEHLREERWGFDSDVRTPASPSGRHFEPAWFGSKPDALPPMWKGIIDAIPTRAGQEMERSEAGREGHDISPPDNVPGCFHRVDHQSWQVEPGGKRRRTGPGPESKGHLDRRSQVAIPVMEPGGQGTTAKSEDTPDVRRCMSDSSSDPSVGRKPQPGAEVCSPTTFEPGQPAARCSHSHPLEAGREPQRPGSSRATYAPAQVGRQRHHSAHPYADEADDAAEIAAGGCNLPQIAQVLRGIMTTSLMNPHFAGSGMDHPFDDTARA